MRRLACILIALALPSTGSAANWVFVSDCGEGGQVRAYSYDRDSVRRDHENVLVRMRGDYSRSAGSRSQEAQLLWSFNCASRTFVERLRVEYAPNRQIVAKYDMPTGRMAITPDSVAGKVHSLVCA